MELAGNTQKVLLRDFQMHPWKQQCCTSTSSASTTTTRLRMKVPLHFGGEENSPAVKTDKCLVSHVATDLEVECLASQLPEFIAVDLSGLAKGQSLHVSDICRRPAGIKCAHGKLNPVIVAVTLPKVEEEEAATADAAAAGAAPAAGAAAAPAAAAAAAPAAAKTAKAPAAPAKDDKKKK